YQAAKTFSIEEREQIRNAFSPAKAKKIGRSVTLREDWENIKIDIMTDLVRQKFNISSFKEKLLATKDAELIEGNWWGDTFWGVCKGVGKNNLGKILMEIRKEINESITN